MFVLKFNLKETIDNYIRVLKISRKPTMDEFKQTSKVSAIGIAIIGIIGFIFFALSVLFVPG